MRNLRLQVADAPSHGNPRRECVEPTSELAIAGKEAGGFTHQLLPLLTEVFAPQDFKSVPSKHYQRMFSSREPERHGACTGSVCGQYLRWAKEIWAWPDNSCYIKLSNDQ